MNITHTIYNSVYKRYESYSETDDLNIYYNFYSPDKTKIMIRKTIGDLLYFIRGQCEKICEKCIISHIFVA